MPANEKSLHQNRTHCFQGEVIHSPLIIHNTDRAHAWWSTREQKALSSGSLVASPSWFQRPRCSLWDNHVIPLPLQRVRLKELQLNNPFTKVSLLLWLQGTEPFSEISLDLVCNLHLAFITFCISVSYLRTSPLTPMAGSSWGAGAGLWIVCIASYMSGPSS